MVGLETWWYFFLEKKKKKKLEIGCLSAYNVYNVFEPNKTYVN